MMDIPLAHPGEHLGEILDDLGLGVAEFPQAAGIYESRLTAIVGSRESITAEGAVRIGRALDMTPEFWFSLQLDYDLEAASEEATEIEPILGACCCPGGLMIS
ncbi:MAG: HigA family addiction module antitoxin [Dehalococcoidia bacterium]|nr:HigA family addiction module antitoxin [Dehalococcoidia bacterium]